VNKTKQNQLLFEKVGGKNEAEFNLQMQQNSD